MLTFTHSTRQLTGNLVVRQLLGLVGTHEAAHTKQVNIPLVGILLQLSDFQSRLWAGVLDAGDNCKARSVCALTRGVRTLTAVERMHSIIMPSEFFDLVIEQRHSSRSHKLQKSDKR